MTLATAALCLALGLAASAAALRIVDRLYLQPPTHVRESRSLFRVYFSQSLAGLGQVTSDSTSYPNYLGLQQQAGGAQGWGAFSSLEIPFEQGSRARKVRVEAVTGSYLHLLGVTPLHGRLLAAEDGEAARPTTAALVSEDFWRSDLGARPDVVGGPLRLGGTVYTVVGILPSGFVGIDLETVDVWLPLASVGELLGGSAWANSRGSSFLSIVARLRHGRSPAAAEAECSQTLRRLASEAGEPDPQARALLAPVQRARGPNRPAAARIALATTALAGALLLIACGNVAHLLLVRSLERQREIALRLALGAGRGRIVRLILAEGIFAAALGSLAALVLLFAGRAWLPAFSVPALSGDLRSWAILAGLGLAAGVASGLLPALWVLRRERAGLRGTADGGERAQARLRQILLAGQVALTFILLVACGVFLRNLRDLTTLRPGFDADRVWVVSLEETGAEPAAQAHDRLRRLPGVERAALATSVPFESSLALPLAVPGLPALPELPSGGPYVSGASADFFATLGARMRHGRAFDAGGLEREVVVNETAARLLWPGEAALGRCLQIGGSEAPCSTVVGVVEDLHRLGLREPPSLQLYVPLAAVPAGLPRALFIRADTAPPSPGSVRREVQAATGLPFVEVRLLLDLAEPELRPWRTGATLLSLLGVLALVLSGIGLYGAVAHAVLRRAREWGIRMALGARGWEVWGPLLAQTAKVVAAGLGAGAVLVLLIRPRIEPLLSGLSLLAPIVWLGAAAVLAVITATAVLPLARRMRRLDPAAVLREE